MDSVIFVEVVGRDGEVVARHEVASNAFPLTLRLHGDAAQAVRVEPMGTATTATPLVVPAAIPPVSHRPGSWLFHTWYRMQSPLGVLAVSVTAFVSWLILAYLITPDSGNSARIFGFALFALLPMLIWSGSWALGGRIAHHPAHFLAQWVWTCVTTLGAILAVSLSGWTAFLFPASGFAESIVFAVWVLLLTLTLYGHITIATRVPKRKRMVVSAAIVVSLLAVGSLAVYAMRDRFDTNLDYTATLRPLDARFIPTETVEEFTTNIADLQQDLDKAAKE